MLFIVINIITDINVVYRLLVPGLLRLLVLWLFLSVAGLSLLLSFVRIGVVSSAGRTVFRVIGVLCAAVFTLHSNSPYFIISLPPI